MVEVVNPETAVIERALERRVRIQSSALTDRFGATVGVDEGLLQGLIELGICGEALPRPIEIGQEGLR